MKQPALPRWEDYSHNKIRDVPVRVPWALLQLLLPRGIRRKWRTHRPNPGPHSSSVTRLTNSFSPLDTLRLLGQRRWSLYDVQYMLIVATGIFSLCVMRSPGPLIKIVFSCALLVSLMLPITSQFTLPGLPVIAWLGFWYACQFVPSDLRPAIWVRLLPAMDNMLYGLNLSNVISQHHIMILDVLAWLPYGILHFIAPVIVAGFLFVFGPPTMASVFTRSFGFLCLTGVLIQFFFPCSPPWYESQYGFAPAWYGMPGSPGGLARIDGLFGLDMYTSSFTANPVPFGAFPSLHAGTATLEALFMTLVFPKLKLLFTGYAFWVWWSTLYLSHHYAVDLMGGGILAACVFYYAKPRFIPSVQRGKSSRWEYEYVDVGESRLDDKLAGLLGYCAVRKL